MDRQVGGRQVSSLKAEQMLHLENAHPDAGVLGLTILLDLYQPDLHKN